MINRNSAVAKLDRVVIDLAGYCPESPTYLQMRARINHLINTYLSIDTLSDRLGDLPSQFITPHMRPWGAIDWRSIRSIFGLWPIRPELCSRRSPNRSKMKSTTWPSSGGLAAGPLVLTIEARSRVRLAICFPWCSTIVRSVPTVMIW